MRKAPIAASSAPTVEELDRELIQHAAVAHAALTKEQECSAALAARLAVAEGKVAALAADLEAVRTELGRARAELRWLRRARIDLNAVMAHPAVAAGRGMARAVIRRRRPRVEGRNPDAEA